MDNMNDVGGSSMMWIFALLILLFCGGGFGGYGRNGDAATQEILFGQQFGALDNKIDRIGNGIADATFALNNAITSEGRGIQTQLSQMQLTECSNTQKILDALAQNKIDALTAKVNELQMQNAMCGVVRYPMSYTYATQTNPFCGCGCNNGI